MITDPSGMAIGKGNILRLGFRDKKPGYHAWTAAGGFDQEVENFVRSFCSRVVFRL